MKVLIGCEESQKICIALRKLGIEAYSCDLQSCSGGHPEWHLKGNVLHYLDEGWDMAIFHPECKYLANSGVRWLWKGGNIKSGKKDLKRWKQMEEAAHFFLKLLNAPIPKIAIENPVMHKYASRIIGKKPDQSIQPYNFGNNASKRTCWWLKGLPPLVPTRNVKPRIVNGKKRWNNQTDSGQNSLAPSEDRSKLRSKTYSGIARAIANQWVV